MPPNCNWTVVRILEAEIRAKFDDECYCELADQGVLKTDYAYDKHRTPPLLCGFTGLYKESATPVHR